MQVLDQIRNMVRAVMARVARVLNSVTGGRLHPNAITIVGLLAHLPIAWLIYLGGIYDFANSDYNHSYWIVAGIALAVFGLFDTLDGELARLQKRESPAGMFLDSVTDRIKEVIIYLGLMTVVTSNSCDCGEPGNAFNMAAVILLAVLAGSLLVSYINAWGEAVMSRAGATSSQMNKTFRGGLASFEIRMTLIVFGLLTGLVLPTIIFIGLLVSLTIIGRIWKVMSELRRV